MRFFEPKAPAESVIKLTNLVSDSMRLTSKSIEANTGSINNLLEYVQRLEKRVAELEK